MVGVGRAVWRASPPPRLIRILARACVRIRNGNKSARVRPGFATTWVDGVELRRVRRKSLYLGDSSDMDSRAGSQHTVDRPRPQ